MINWPNPQNSPPSNPSPLGIISKLRSNTLIPPEKKRRLPVESDTLASNLLPPELYGFPGNTTGDPELKLSPA